MKKTLLTTICLILVFSAGAQKHADRQSLTDPESFTMVVFGDPQGYTKYGCNQPLFELSTAWIADNENYKIEGANWGRQVWEKLIEPTPNIRLGGGWEGNGGDGWLRLLEFLPDGRTIKATTYSVLFGISPMTKHLAHRTDPCCQFEMVIDR